MLWDLCVRLWNDEAGAVIATEYLMLGSVVALGSASGMAAMRDAVNDEYKDMGQSVHEARQAYAIPAANGPKSSKAGSNLTDASTGFPHTGTQFSCPNP